MMDPVGEQKKIRVLCVDDSADVVLMLELCIGAEPDMEIVGGLSSADELVGEVERTRADVVLLDMGMPGKDPLDALRELVGAGRGADGRGAGGARVIAYSGRNTQQDVDRAADAGAWGNVSKSAEISRVLDAIREVARGNVAF